MKESDLTKLTRWIVPGWIAIISFYGLVLVDMLFTLPGQPMLFPDITQFLNQYSDLTGLLITIIVGATGVPIGFIIYQIYFFLRWNSPFSRDGLIPPMLSGRMQDLERTMAGLELSDLTGESEWKEKWTTDPLFQRDHGIRWRFIENSFNEAAQILDSTYSAVSIYAKHRYLHEITHTLGASIIAVYLGYVGYFALKISTEKLSLPIYLLVLFVFGGFLFYLLNREDDFKQQTKFSEKILNSRSMKKAMSNDPIPTFTVSLKIPFKKALVEISVTHPSAILVFGLLVIHFLNNPVLIVTHSNQDLFFRVISALIIIILWISSKSKISSAYRAGDGIGLLSSLIVAIILTQLPFDFKKWIDWSYFSTMSIFLASILILYKNRQNAKDDMLALENYTLKRYFQNEESINGKKGKKS